MDDDCEDYAIGSDVKSEWILLLGYNFLNCSINVFNQFTRTGGSLKDSLILYLF